MIRTTASPVSDRVIYMYVRTRVRAGGKRERITRISDTEFEIEVREPAARNRANRRVVSLIADAFAVPSTKVQLVSGHHSTVKMLDVQV